MTESTYNNLKLVNPLPGAHMTVLEVSATFKGHKRG